MVGDSLPLGTTGEGSGLQTLLPSRDTWKAFKNPNAWITPHPTGNQTLQGVGADISVSKYP